MSMVTSAEIRWFHEGPLSKEVDEWFSASGLISKPETRDDYYLAFPSARSVGVKFRDGKLEVKPLVSTISDRTYPAGVAGHAQIWEKWSYGDKESASLLIELQQMLIKDGEIWITVSKERRLRKISMDEDKPIAVDPESRPRNGCNIELTKIRVHGRSYWSFGLEAFGEPSHVETYLDKAAEYILGGHKESEDCPISERLQNYFSLQRSLSYPEWLSRLNEMP